MGPGATILLVEGDATAPRVTTLLSGRLDVGAAQRAAVEHSKGRFVRTVAEVLTERLPLGRPWGRTLRRAPEASLATLRR
jgi:hypothetical protein